MRARIRSMSAKYDNGIETEFGGWSVRSREPAIHLELELQCDEEAGRWLQSVCANGGDLFEAPTPMPLPKPEPRPPGWGAMAIPPEPTADERRTKMLLELQKEAKAEAALRQREKRGNPAPASKPAPPKPSAPVGPIAVRLLDLEDT